MPNPWEMDWSGVPNDSSPWEFDWGDPNKLQAGRQYSPEDAAAVGKAQGLSEDEIKRNYALKFAQTPEAAQPNMGLGVLGAHAQGVPVAGALVPDLPSIDWLKREHPTVANIATATGAGVGAVPAMALAPGGVAGAVTMGGLVSGADAAARQTYDPNAGKGLVGNFDPSKFDPEATKRAAAIGGGAALGGRLLSRLISPTNINVGKSQLPQFEHLPEGVKNTVGAATILGTIAKDVAKGDYIGAVKSGTEAGLAHSYATPRIYDLLQPALNRMYANKAHPFVQDVVNALIAGQKPQQ